MDLICVPVGSERPLPPELRTCAACQGSHRAHTCGRAGKRGRKKASK